MEDAFSSRKTPEATVPVRRFGGWCVFVCVPSPPIIPCGARVSHADSAAARRGRRDGARRGVQEGAGGPSPRDGGAGTAGTDVTATAMRLAESADKGDDRALLRRLVELDRRVDGAEHTGMRARLEFGRELLAARVGKQLPKGFLDELCQQTGKSRQEIQFRMQFAKRVPTKHELSNVVRQFFSWHAIINEFLRSDRSGENRAGLHTGLVLSDEDASEKQRGPTSRASPCHTVPHRDRPALARPATWRDCVSTKWCRSFLSL